MNASLIWSSKQLKSPPESTCEAETAQASRATKDLIFTKAGCQGAKRPVYGPVPLLVDNSAMYQLAAKEGVSQRTRYFERATMFVKWAVLRFMAMLFLIPSEFMLADIFTKAVDQATFHRLRNNMLNLVNDEPIYATYAKAAYVAKTLSSLMSRIGGF